jgi:hypothetical protein
MSGYCASVGWKNKKLFFNAEALRRRGRKGFLLLSQIHHRSPDGMKWNPGM